MGYRWARVSFAMVVLALTAWMTRYEHISLGRIADALASDLGSPLADLQREERRLPRAVLLVLAPPVEVLAVLTQALSGTTEELAPVQHFVPPVLTAVALKVAGFPGWERLPILFDRADRELRNLRGQEPLCEFLPEPFGHRWILLMWAGLEPFKLVRGSLGEPKENISVCHS